MKNILISLILLAMLGFGIYNVTLKDALKQDIADKFDITEDRDRMLDNGGHLEAFYAEETEAEDALTSSEVGINVGQKAPDFSLKTLHNETVKLSELQGQKVLLNFWASWCPPCRAEMPDMQRFYEESDVQILAVNLIQTEKRPSDVQEFVEEFGLTFPILLDEDSQVAMLYEILPIPTSYLIDSQGYVRHVFIGPMNYEMMVKQFSQMN